MAAVGIAGAAEAAVYGQSVQAVGRLAIKRHGETMENQEANAEASALVSGEN